MAVAENKAVVRRQLAAIVTDLSGLDALLAPGYVLHLNGDPEVRGLAAYKELMAGYRAAFPDMQVTVEEQVAAGDTVVTRWTTRATHQGDPLGVAPTGKAVTLTGIILSHLRGGQVAEEWTTFDNLGMLQQVGVSPVPAAPGS